MRLAVALCTLLLSVRAWAFGGYDVWLLTMGPGEHLFMRFGHNALLVRDQGSGKTEVYNFGSFYADDPQLLPKYLSRQLMYFLSVSDLERTLYAYEGRMLWAQHLDLPAAAVDRLVAELRRLALPENREYLYDHFRDNCSTRIRDLLDEVTHGALREVLAGAPTQTTFRRETEAMLGPVPFERFGTSYILSSTTDRPISRWEMGFLPRHLRDGLRDIRLTHPSGEVRPLVASERVLLVGQDDPTGMNRWPLLLLALAFLLPVALAALAGGEGRAARVATGVVLTLWGLLTFAGSAVLVFLWTTTVPDTQANGNLLLTTPLHLLLVPLGLGLALGRLSSRGAAVLRGTLWMLLALALGDLLAHVVGWADQSHVGLALFTAAMSGLGIMAIRPLAGAEPAPDRGLGREGS